jgi:hypothetical protein
VASEYRGEHAISDIHVSVKKLVSSFLEVFERVGNQKQVIYSLDVFFFGV